MTKNVKKCICVKLNCNFERGVGVSKKRIPSMGEV